MSGKAARRLRKQYQKQSVKNHFFSKKTLAACAGLCLSYAPVAAGGDFLISLYPQITKPFGESHEMEYGIGGGIKATWRPVNFLNVFAQGDYLSMAIPGIDPVQILEGSVGAGYHLDVTDRIAFDLNANVGVYNAKSKSSANGISAGGALTFTYKINPSIYVDVNATARHYAAKPSPLMMVNAGVAPGVTFNITEIFNNRTKVKVEVAELAPVFPVLYSWYENNSFGKVTITNNEESSISDVTVSFFQPQYMVHAKECATIRNIPQGESVTVDLIAFFNEQMLELTQKTDTNSYIIVNYSRLGKKLSQTYAMDVPVYGRNNMSWDDDRRAAVFVSSKDPAAMQFAKYTASIVRDNLRVDVPVNIQYALGIFQALNEFGLNYVIDPTSAFEDNVGTSSIDFLQFPYQTLMYRGGDCDDLSILVCSLFEAVGIRTAFITVPGHIFMAFDAGITPEVAENVFRNTSDFIIADDEVWVPLEITLSDEGFYRACRYGAREWNNANANGTAALYKMNDSWKIYQPISVPGAVAYFNMPESNSIAYAFVTGLEEWSRGEFKTIVGSQPVFVAMKDDEVQEEQVVLKGRPLSTKTLNDILSIADVAVAVTPASVRKEDSDDETDSASGNDSGDGDGNDSDYGESELLEDLIPLDFAIATATLQTDVPVKASETDPAALESEDAVSSIEPEKTTVAMAAKDDTSFLDDYFDILEGKAPPLTRKTAEIVKPEEDDVEADFPILEAIASMVESFESTVSSKPAASSDETVADLASDSGLASASSTASASSAAVSASGSDGLSSGTAISALEEIVSAAGRARSGSQADISEKPETKTIVIISTLTAAAVIAAGIIILGKKRKREGESK